MIKYTEEKTFTQDQVQELFKSVGWISAEYPQRLHKALMNSQTVLTAWDGERLVGLARVLDDSELVAFVHYVLVHPEYQGQKIAGNMVEYIRDKYKNYLYIEGMQEDSKNVAFYERHGFHVMEGGTPIQICNFSDKR
jgi:GNAT superfamily N-acetyltransferase